MVVYQARQIHEKRSLVLNRVYIITKRMGFFLKQGQGKYMFHGQNGDVHASYV